MKHLRRILAVAVPLIAAAYSTALMTPAVTNFISSHPAVAIYLVSVAGVVHAIVKAFNDRSSAAGSPAPPSGGSSMGAV